MPDVSRRNRRRVRHSDSRTPRATRSQNLPAPRSYSRSGRTLLERLLDEPNLPAAVPRLQPEVLHRIIERCGLEDCGALIALATPAQLSAVFDLDLWRSDTPGLDERFDIDRFGTWLEVMVEEDVDAAARTLASLDPGLVSTALAGYVAVFDLGSLELSFQSDDDHGYRPIERAVDADLQAEIGGYRIVSKRQDTWDAIVDVLIALDATHQRAFHAVVGRCRRLSNDGWEQDGLDDLLSDEAQASFEVAGGRLQRRERQGYVSVSDAQAFLRLARELRVDADSAPASAAFWRTYLDRDDTHDAGEPHGERESETLDGQPNANASRTESRGWENAGTVGAREVASVEADGLSAPSLPGADVQPAARILELLADDGLLPQRVRGLLDAPAEGAGNVRLQKLDAYLRSAFESSADLYARRAHELSLLANTLLSGCPLQSRPFTPQEASDAAVAVCNLGLETWPSHWSRVDGADFAVKHDLFVVFQAGASVLHQRVCVQTAERLVTILDTLGSGDTDLENALLVTRDLMKRQIEEGTPWVAAESLDVVMSLDVTAWAALVALIAPFPVIHEAMSVVRGKGPKRIDPAAFQFIADESQIAFVNEFLAALPRLLQAG